MTRAQSGPIPPRRPLVALVRIVALLLLTAAAALAQTDPWQEAELAFVGPDGRLHVGWTDGRVARPLSSMGERAQFPSWSPDGERIAAIVSGGAAGRVVVFDAAGDETELYAGSGVRGPIYHYWSPAGDQVAFLANAPGTGLELRLAALDDGPSTVLAAGSPFYWQWTADGERLLIHVGFSGPGSRLGFTDAAEDTLADNVAPPGFFQAPGISAGGDWIAYSALAPGGARRVTLRALAGAGAGSDGTRQVEHEGIAALAWSPVDDLLAFTAPPVPAPISAGPLQLIDARDGFLRTLSDDLALAFFWSPDGERIAYVTPLGGGDDPDEVAALPAPVGAGALQQVGALQRVGTPVQGARRLLQLKVVEIASGRIDTLTTFAPSRLWLGQFLPFFDQYALSHRVWSQDGRALVLPMADERGVPRVTVVGLDGMVTPIEAGDMPFWRWR